MYSYIKGYFYIKWISVKTLFWSSAKVFLYQEIFLYTCRVFLYPALTVQSHSVLEILSIVIKNESYTEHAGYTGITYNGTLSKSQFYLKCYLNTNDSNGSESNIYSPATSFVISRAAVVAVARAASVAVARAATFAVSRAAAVAVEERKINFFLLIHIVIKYIFLFLPFKKIGP